MSSKEMILPYCGLIEAVIQRALWDAQGCKMGNLRPPARADAAAEAREFLADWGLSQPQRPLFPKESESTS